MPQNVRITLSELRQLRRRIDQRTLESDDWTVVAALVSKRIVQAERQQAKMAAKALHDAEMMTSASEVSGPVIDADYAVVGTGEEGDGEACSRASVETEDGPQGCSRPNSSDSREDTPSSKPKPKRRGHGRNGAAAYVNAEHDFHALMPDVVGALCEACGRGPLSPYRDKLIVRIKGQPLFDAEVHHFEQARCRLCGAIVRAHGAATVLDGLGSSYITYDWSACAMLLVMHYFAGLPFKRIELLQLGWGIPVADANQWSMSNISDDLLFPLYKALERHGIQQAYALRLDDTGAMIISVRKDIRAEFAALEQLGESTRDVRTGINATGVYLETKQGRVLLFFTGRHHAGEIIDQLLQFRRAGQNKGKLVKVSDAASKNFSHAHQDELEEAVCNAHAFLKFRAIKEQYTEVYNLAGEVYKKVFDNDDVAKDRGMSPDERMLYHREHSLPEMKRLKKICGDKLKDKLIEPNSPLWEPVTFIINQWERLKKFCEVPGIPLDTNVVEQMLIIPVRYLASSFNYQTQNGADVGDRHMSLIATANANGVEPTAYLTECLRNHEDLARRPEYYLPWVYRARIDESKQTCARSNQCSTTPAPEHPLRPGTRRAHPYRATPTDADLPAEAELGR